MATTITRTEQADTITYAAIVDGADVAQLVIWSDRREVANIETAATHRRQGLARMLWDYANAEAECFHSLDHHRTTEGDAFAHAVGGETIDTVAGFVAECSICTADDDEDDDTDW